MDRYGAAIEYDLHAVHSLDLLDFFRGRHPWGKLLRLLEQLPPWSRYGAARADDEEHAEWVLSLPEDVIKRASGPAMWQWTPDVAALTDIKDLLKEQIRTAVAAAGGKPPSVQPERRPRTAVDRVRARREMAHLDGLAAEVEAAQARWEAARG